MLRVLPSTYGKEDWITIAWVVNGEDAELTWPTQTGIIGDGCIAKVALFLGSLVGWYHAMKTEFET